MRDRFDARSYLYNTDGIVFSNAGYPVILLNEHINGIENLNRPHYHSTSDSVKFLDFSYAASIARVAIETAARLAAGH
ncbi:MAG: M28 family peptidase [Deltaproteobacteria bacterium]|nr:M28 family peptidase [Deltaproteobacteria bacterium]